MIKCLVVHHAAIAAHNFANDLQFMHKQLYFSVLRVTHRFNKNSIRNAMERSFITWEFCRIFCTLFVTIFNARVPFFRFSDLRNTLLITCMLLCSSFLAPVFWQLWIYAGSANANFFFAITLAYSTAQVTSVLMAR